MPWVGGGVTTGPVLWGLQSLLTVVTQHSLGEEMGADWRETQNPRPKHICVAWHTDLFPNWMVMRGRASCIDAVIALQEGMAGLHLVSHEHLKEGYCLPDHCAGPHL